MGNLTQCDACQATPQWPIRNADRRGWIEITLGSKSEDACSFECAAALLARLESHMNRLGEERARMGR